MASRENTSSHSALRLARHFGTSPVFWLSLQTSYDLELVERAAGARIRNEVLPRQAA